MGLCVSQNRYHGSLTRKQVSEMRFWQARVIPSPWPSHSNQLKLLRSGYGEMPYDVQFCYFLGHCYSKRILSPCLFTDKSHFPVEKCGLLKPGLFPPLASCAPPKAISSPVFFFYFLDFAPTHHVLPRILTPVLASASQSWDLLSTNVSVFSKVCI